MCIFMYLVVGSHVLSVYDDAGRDVISTKSCYFAGDLRHHVHGSVFHPYLVPFGYQRCAVCACVVSKCDISMCSELKSIDVNTCTTLASLVPLVSAA